MDIYGQENPPEYDLTQINVPIGLYWSQNDWLAHPTVSVNNFYLCYHY